MEKLVAILSAFSLILIVGCESPTTPLAENDADGTVQSDNANTGIAKNGNSHGKATGGFVFENPRGLSGRATFEVHDLGGPGDDRGTVRTSGPNTTLRLVMIDCVVIDGNEALFSGVTVRVRGQAAPPGTRIAFKAVDAGTPGRTGDKFRAHREDANNNCPGGFVLRLNDVVDGNLVVH